MAAVNFTKNLSPENRSSGLYLLGVWWRASPLNSSPLYKMTTSYDGLVKYWDKNYPTAIEWLGELTSTYNLQVMSDIMKDAAKNEGLEYVRPSYVTKRLLNKGLNTGNLSFAAQAVGQTASDIGSFISGLSKVGLFLSIAFFLWIGWAYFKVFKNTIPK